MNAVARLWSCEAQATSDSKKLKTQTQTPHSNIASLRILSNNGSRHGVTIIQQDRSGRSAQEAKGPGPFRWPDATTAPSYSYITERADLHTISISAWMGNQLARPCSGCVARQGWSAKRFTPGGKECQLDTWEMCEK
eukprot:1160064-Pelagomonas_calceolata.AAC.4